MSIPTYNVSFFGIVSVSKFLYNTSSLITYKAFTTTRSLRMPLVVPGITTSDGGKTEEWTNKLVGKKFSEEAAKPDTTTTFTKADLPEEHRIIQPGQMVTKDFKENRLNVHLKEDGTVSHVDHQ